MTRNSILTLAKRELAMMVNSLATYVVAVFFLLLIAWLFVSPLFANNISTLDAFFQPVPLLFAFLVPALTMRSFAEEFKGGTIEYLSTLPLEDYEIVLAKYAAFMTLMGVLIGFTLPFAVVLFVIGRPDVGQVVGGYIAVLSLTSFYGAIGLWASALTRNQVVAFIVSFFVSFVFFLFSRLAELLPGMMSNFVQVWSVTEHYGGLIRGVLDARDMVYWVSGTFFFLAACLAVVQSRKWR